MPLVTIDDQQIEVPEGTTILQAARMIGGDIVPPAMCYYSKLKTSGGYCKDLFGESGAGFRKKILDQCLSLWPAARPQ